MNDLEEVHADQPVDVLVPEREHRKREVRRRHAEHGELGHAKPVAMFVPDGGVTLAFLNPSRWLYPIFSSRVSVVRPVGPTTSASTRINSRSRTKELESLVIDDQRGSNQRLGADAGEPDGETGVPYVEVTDRREGSIMRGAMPDDARRLDLGAPKLDPHDLDQTDELIGIPRADLCPRQRLGRDWHELFGGVHASIFPGGRSLSSFLPPCEHERREAATADRSRLETRIAMGAIK
ncbi:MAG: hypothetical protein E6J90_49160 [Deltaproteobacteria bacterium]|nr:MAG: hypothetical protein E6J90_49160 [Deltaproteobacteria bacterium]